MLNLITVGEHTILDIPKKTGKVLDVGCRFFHFSKAMEAKGYEAYAVEPDTDVKNQLADESRLMRAALVAPYADGQGMQLIKYGNGEGDHLVGITGDNPPDAQIQAVSAISIESDCKLMEVKFWDIIKLDCEGDT